MGRWTEVKMGDMRMTRRGIKMDMSVVAHSAGSLYGTSFGRADPQYHEAYDWDKGHHEKPPKTLRGLLSRFASFTSFQGIPFIQRARRPYSRAIWTILFCLGLAATATQLYLVISKYYKRETSSMVKIGFDTLDFPSVTICNLNPMRDSKINRSTDLGDFLNSIKPRDDYNTEFSPPPPPPPPPSKGSDPSSSPFSPGKVKRSIRERRQAQPKPDVTPPPGGGVGRRGPPPGIGGSIFPDSSTLWSPYDEYRKGLDAEEQLELDESFGSGTSSAFNYIENTFRTLSGNISDEIRAEWGHQGELFILDCSFNGRVCSYKNFSQSLSTLYGNCFTFNSHNMLKKPLKSARGGAPHGLNLVLYLEKNEYVPGFTSGAGARIAIHPFNTMPFLEEHGMSAAPGFETFMGMKMINMSKLGSPYSDCGDDGTFEKTYNFNYTLDGCLNTCLDRQIAAWCKCRRLAFPEYYSQTQLKSLPGCNETGTDASCIQPVLNGILSARSKCSCNEPCKEIQYDILTSSNMYPEGNMWYTLVDTICTIDNEACEYIYSQEEQQARVLEENILRVRIFYRDLNFQSIQEIATYDEYQFLSDLGGSLGLWVGASVLTCLEVVDLLIHLFKFFCCDRPKQNSLRRRTKSSTLPSSIHSSGHSHNSAINNYHQNSNHLSHYDDRYR